MGRRRCADQPTRESTGQTVTSYLYDPNGNLTKKDDGTNVHGYKYDVRNLMTDYDGPGANNDATYKYGASGLRVQKTVAGSTTTKYYHDGLNVVAEYNGSDQLQRTYVTPGLDQNLSLTASGSTYYYLSDALGSIRQVIDADQATQNSYDYQAFGSVYGNPTENVTQPFRFTGREWDAETGLYYYRMRDYAAARGTFTSRDPIYPFWVPRAYGYVMNLPTFLVDPLGLDAIFTIDWDKDGYSHVGVYVYTYEGDVYTGLTGTMGFHFSGEPLFSPGIVDPTVFIPIKNIPVWSNQKSLYRLLLTPKDDRQFLEWLKPQAQPGKGWVYSWFWNKCNNWFQPGLEALGFEFDAWELFTPVSLRDWINRQNEARRKLPEFMDHNYGGVNACNDPPVSGGAH